MNLRYARSNPSHSEILDFQAKDYRLEMSRFGRGLAILPCSTIPVDSSFGQLARLLPELFHVDVVRTL